MDEPKSKPGSVFQRAFFNQYNYILLGGSALLSAASGSWLPAVVGAGAEILWLVLGADSGAFRRWVAGQEAKEAEAAAAREVAAMVAGLDESYVERWKELGRLSQEIQSLARENRGFEALLLKDEMAKLGQVMRSFLKMAWSHQRLSRYFYENPGAEIERDIARSQRTLKSETDSRVQASVKQALALAQKRLRQHQEIEAAWKALSVQMETLEKAFAYLKSHILGIGTSEELQSELDNLVAGVSSVAELDASTDELMRDLRAQGAARASVAQRQR